MDYDTLLEYIEATQIRIICRTRKMRAEAVGILKELNPSLNTVFISQKYDATEYPYLGYDRSTKIWALWKSPSATQLLTVDALRELVRNPADKIEISCGSLEDVL